MLHVPLLISALLFAGFAFVEWRRAPVWGRIHLAVATAFALAPFAGLRPVPRALTLGAPLAGAAVHVVGVAQLTPVDGIAYVVGIARGAGMVAALVTVVTRLREHAFR